jgi:hypothetical protein
MVSLGPALRARSAAARAGTVLRATAFWSAVVLPFVAIVAIVGGEVFTAVLLLACNVAALVVGHGYASDRPNC